MNIYRPFTYLIGWTKHDKWYYGVRYAVGCGASDLWSTYFTSSKHVHKFREENGEPDVVQIRQLFNDAITAHEWEIKVIRRMRAIWDDRWLNKGLAGRSDRRGQKDSPETAEKKRLTRTGMKQRPEVIARRVERMKGMKPENFTTKGFRYSEESKAKMSMKRKEYIARLAAEGKRMPVFYAPKKPVSEETRRKRSENGRKRFRIPVEVVSELKDLHDSKIHYEEYEIVTMTKSPNGVPLTYTRFLSKKLGPIYNITPNMVHNILTGKART